MSISEESPYAKLGDVQPVNLLQFAHQISAGMVIPIVTCDVGTVYVHVHQLSCGNSVCTCTSIVMWEQCMYILVWGQCMYMNITCSFSIIHIDCLSL